MSRENPLCGAPRIHGELLKLGVQVHRLADSIILTSDWLAFTYTMILTWAVGPPSRCQRKEVSGTLLGQVLVTENHWTKYSDPKNPTIRRSTASLKMRENVNLR